MYEIKNISRHLKLLGLYPGEKTDVSYLTDDIKLLYDRQLVAISLKEEKKKVKKEENIKECEVVDIYGRD